MTRAVDLARRGWDAVTEDGISSTDVLSSGSTTLRSLGDRFADVVNVKDFGAVGDGVTDDTAAIQAAIDSRAGIVYLPTSSYRVNSTGMTAYSDTRIHGDGKSLTTINVTPSSSTIVIDVQLASGSYNSFEFKGLSIVTDGDTEGTSIIKTPRDAAGLSNEHSYYIRDIYGLGTVGWTNALDVGDSILGEISDVDLRSTYNTGIADSGQVVTTAILYGGASGAFGLVIKNFKVSGYRTGVEIQNGVEAFYIVDGEITNSWRGIFSLPSHSSPGGAIHNVHISANLSPVKIARRRNFNVSNVQLYRTTGVAYDHTEEWIALLIDSCGRANISDVTARHPDEYKSATVRTCLRIASSSNISVTGVVGGYEDGLSNVVDVTNSSGISVLGITAEAVSDSLVSLRGNNNHILIGSVVALSTIPDTPYIIQNPNDTIRLSRDSTHISRVRFVDVTSTTSDDTYNAGVDPLYTRYNLTGASSYTFLLNVQNINAQVGDTFNFQVVISSQSNGTFRLLTEGSTVDTSITGGNNYSFVIMFTGTEWMLVSRNNNAA